QEGLGGVQERGQLRVVEEQRPLAVEEPPDRTVHLRSDDVERSGGSGHEHESSCRIPDYQGAYPPNRSGRIPVPACWNTTSVDHGREGYPNDHDSRSALPAARSRPDGARAARGGGAVVLLRVLPAEDRRGGAAALAGDPGGGGAPADLRLRDLRRGRQHPR